MRIRTESWRLFLALNAVLVAGTGARTHTVTHASQKVPESEKQRQLRSVEGVDLFHLYCATCHGKDGKGGGPVAFAMKVPVPDLTVITKTNGGTFPVARMRKIILCEVAIESHGPRRIPVWGPIFQTVDLDMDRRRVRVENLFKYLESIQVKSKP